MGMSRSFLVVFVGGLALAVLIQAQDQSGFISIDCGAPANVSYTETNTSINYISDANFINTGINGEIAPKIKEVYFRPMWTVRSFPEGKRNCYNINITRNSKYLIRTRFLYGNYDGKNMLPQFDLHLGANLWDTISISNASISQTKEIIHIPSLDYLQICLVDTGNGTPFISVIELRTLPNNTYVTKFGSLRTYIRWDLGSNRGYRYKDDVYDRLWYYDDEDSWTQLNVSISTSSVQNNVYQVPPIVMSTAVMPTNANASLEISWKPQNQTEEFYVYMHFMEIEVLAKNQIREFNITLNGETLLPKFSPQYMAVTTFYNSLGISGKEISFSFEMTKNSTLPPIINAFEIYRRVEF